MANIFVVLYPDQQYNVLAPGNLYYRGASPDVTPPPQPETNPHFIGRYSTPRYSFFQSVGGPPDGPLPTQPETNPHFVGRYAAPRYRFFQSVGAPEVPPLPLQPETNTHTIGRFRPSRLRYLTLLRQNLPFDVPPPAQPETNVHFIGQFRAARYRVLSDLWSTPALDYAIPLPVVAPPIPPVPHNQAQAEWSAWLTQIARTLNLTLGGKFNATAVLTLATVSSVTDLYDSRIGPASFLIFSPRSPTAATEMTTGLFYYEVPNAGHALVHHSSSPRADRVFSVLIIG